MFTDFESCPVCKGPVTVRTVDGQWRPYCTQCQVILQLGPKLVATVLIGDSSNLLMVQRSYGEEKGRWALPGGYVEQGEVVEEAAAREALEETGLKVDITGLVGLFSAPAEPSSSQPTAPRPWEAPSRRSPGRSTAPATSL